jgi:hypothetical protein
MFFDNVVAVEVASQESVGCEGWSVGLFGLSFFLFTLHERF